MDTDTASIFWFVVPGIVVPGALLLLSFWSPTKRQVDRWGAACDVVITADNEPMIRSHLGRSRRFRSVASFPFWWLACVRVVDAGFPSALATPAIGIAAYLLGALVAELTSPLAVPSGVRSASFAPRLIGDYRPAWIRWLVLALFGIAAVATIVGFTVVDAAGAEARNPLPTLGMAVVVVVVAELTARSIVRRPQRGDGQDRLAADEGLRAAAVSMTSGAALLAGLGAAAVASAAAVPDGTGFWGLVMLPWTLALQAMAVGVLVLVVRQETWGYRRRFPQPAPVVPA